MTDQREKSLQAGPEQVLYAYVLEKGMYFGLLFIIITFIIYATGLMGAKIPLTQIPTLWTMNVHDYLHTIQVSDGWSWVKLVGYGDFLNFIPIAILAGITIICFLSIIPVLWKQNDKVFAVLAFFESLILAIAASGILGSGGH
jgi:hypothetical protein